MTASALVWQPFDPSIAPSTCAYGDCVGTPSVMRGPRTALIRLPWRAYCAAHASLYGVLVHRGRLMSRAG